MERAREGWWDGFVVCLIRKYLLVIEDRICGIQDKNCEDIDCWRERLFSKFIALLLPACLIALIPGVVMAIKAGETLIACSDLFSVIAIAAISLNTRLTLHFRKVFVVIILYLLSIVLIIKLSLLGPGIVYLLSISVLVTVIFPRDRGYLTIGANLGICILVALIIHFKLLDSPLGKDYDLGTWIAVSSNTAFLSLVMSVLIGNTIKVLEKLIAKELLLNDELADEILKGAESNSLLKESKSQYESLFFLNPSPMWVLDKENLQFLQVNEAATKQYGYTNDEFLSMNIGDIKMDEDMLTLHEDIQKNECAGSPIRIIKRHKRKNDEVFYAEVTFNSIVFEGRPATLTISQNITEQIAHIRAIEEQNEKLREIAWIQSHKVRAPLANIMGLVQLFNEKDNVVSTPEILKSITVSATQLDDVIREIVSKSFVPAPAA